MKEPIHMLHAVMPEEYDFTLGDRLGPLHDQLRYIIEMSTELVMINDTYLLLYGSLSGLRCDFLNQAK